MKKGIIFSVLVTLFLMAGFQNFAKGDGEEGNNPSANTATMIKGRILDQVSGESLAGVTVKVEGTDMKTYSDLDGNFSFKDLEPGTYSIVVSYISYKKSLVENIKLKGSDSKVLNVKLVEEAE